MSLSPIGSAVFDLLDHNNIFPLKVGLPSNCRLSKELITNVFRQMICLVHRPNKFLAARDPLYTVHSAQSVQSKFHLLESSFGPI